MGGGVQSRVNQPHERQCVAAAALRPGSNRLGRSDSLLSSPAPVPRPSPYETLDREEKDRFVIKRCSFSLPPFVSACGMHVYGLQNSASAAHPSLDWAARPQG